MDYIVIAYYHFFDIEDPEREAKQHKKFLQALEAKGRIYFSSEGINAQLALHNKHLDEYCSFLSKDPRFDNVDLKFHSYDEPPFAKLTVKSRKQLVALDQKVDLTQRAPHISPKEWCNMMEEKDKNTIVIDVRNNYESEIGHFEGAFCPNLKNFRDFKALADELKEKYDPDTTRILTYCTGGIRCEFFSPLLKEKGFKKIYQLDGGVIKYGEQLGSKHWKGKLFVFDDRLAVPLDEQKKKESISHCKFCSKEVDQYLNCAHMDCNKLFIACIDCAAVHRGCCSTSCSDKNRVRSFNPKERIKPFRKLSFEEKQSFEPRTRKD